MAKRTFESSRRKSLRKRVEAGEVIVTTWEERNRLHIAIEDVENDDILAEWWDDDARQMFEDGFFSSKDLEGSVIDYAAQMGIPAYRGSIKRKR